MAVFAKPAPMSPVQPSRMHIPGSPSPPKMPSFADSQKDFLDTFFQANARSLSQYQQLLGQYGAPLRNLVLQSSPELMQTSKYLQESFANPIPETLEKEYRKHIQQAQIARGFEGGSSPSQAEAVQLTLLAEQRRAQLLPQLMQFGTGILGMTGLQGPNQFDQGVMAQTQLGLARLGQEQYQFQSQQAFQQMQFEESLRASQEQSDFARHQFMLTQQQIQEMTREAKKPTTEDVLEQRRFDRISQGGLLSNYNPSLRGRGWNVTGSNATGAYSY